MTRAGNGKGDAANRVAITVSIMLATVMNSLDTTIANVALPHIQGSVSASADQITWVLTSYIVAATIMTPLTGFLADRLGRKMVFLISIAGFTIASMLCGVAASLFEIVLFRLLQGLFGAALIPLSQAVLLDINPPEKHGQAMAVWGAAAVLGPILGPGLGGWLTDNLDWRWVFFINLPIGILAFGGVFLFLSEKKGEEKRPFDMLGFASLALTIGAFQMMLDRGPGQDWFAATEIWIYLIVAIIAAWIFGVQLATAAKPFVARALLADSNFITCCVFGFFVGILLYSTLALLPPMMQNLLGYPVAFTGLVSMPRGIGSFIAMFAVGQLIGRVNIKLILLAGLSISAISLWQMTHFSLGMDTDLIIVSGFLSGVGTGLIFVPLSTIAFAKVASQYRAEGAGLFTLVRNIGSSAGISIMQARFITGIETHHAVLVEHARPDNPLYQAYAPTVFQTQGAIAGLNNLITRQASMLSYIDDFRLMLVITVLCAPLILLMRTPKATGGETVHVAAD
ncbi:DHA2 family efflux MFS transporter permease subunit [Phenylobacterium sp. Root700]|uniref:DHA2 family efflux MFS transporter permease subunit n=1 Tax=Phenylobacterium sp. Root700 TaxID=1736591 RepID=UPI00070084FF|nr:DHA2 family efflux MFS transporter permease subunit [Phenylobacterium sp. Root700]KRB42531.1 disulfide bond formation protein DsbA [Phenylobacterium sp. Root700]